MSRTTRFGNDDYAIEDALAGSIVQGREAVRQPADGIALSAAGGVARPGGQFPQRGVQTELEALSDAQHHRATADAN